MKISVATSIAILGVLSGMPVAGAPEPTIKSVHSLSPGNGRVVAVAADDPAARRAWQRAVSWYHSLPPAETPVHPDAAAFPGAVPMEAGRVSVTVVIDPNMPRWQSTGLYAAPGETVVVKAPADVTGRGWKIRVGCHSDGLWRLDQWRRLPEISRVFKLDAPEVAVANAFGGLIYIDIPRDPARGGFRVPTFGGDGWIDEKPGNGQSVDLVIHGAVRAPEFRIGRDDPANWKETLAATHAPWGEIAGKHLVMSLPRAELEKIEDPAALAEYWDRALDACWAFAGWPGERHVPERFVFDLQLSAGFMHSGYPIMAHLTSVKDAIDLRQLRSEGQWGLFHELGHNHQGRAYTFNSFVEVTVNLHTLYLMKTMCGLEPREARGRLGDLDEMLRQRLVEKKRGPFEELALYVPLIETFGFESLTRAFQSYLSNDGIAGLIERDADGARMDAWVRHYSQAVGRNLSAYFELFDLSAGDATRRLLADLEAWMPEAGFVAKFAADHETGQALTLPVRFHLADGAVMTVKEQQMDVWVTPEEISGPVLAELNRIWKPANIQFEVERAAVTPLLRPANFDGLVRAVQEATREAEQAGGTRERTRIIQSLLDPEASNPGGLNIHLLPYIGGTYQGFARMEGTQAVVGVWTDKASRGKKPPVRTLLVEPEPMRVGSLARTIAHEIGHNLGLVHPARNEVSPQGRLMGGSKHGYHLTLEEIAKARAIARTHLANWAAGSR